MKNPHLQRLAFSLLSLLPFFWIWGIKLQSFLEDCLNKRYIGWDPVSRLQVSLDIANSWREFSFHKPILLLLDSPTWPALRSIPESFLILVGGPETLWSIVITQATWIFLVLAMGYVIFKEFPSSWGFPLLCLVTLWLDSIEPFRTYAFSGMLEIQGGLFLLLANYFIKNIHGKSGYLVLYFFLLLQTKYPYAIMFLFALTVFLPFIWGNKLFIFLKDIFFLLLGYARKHPIFLFIPIPILLLALGKWGVWEMTGKAPGYLQYFLFVLVFIFLGGFIFRIKEKMEEFSPVLRTLVVYVYLGGMGYLFLHPDRFRATFSTIKHEQGSGESFFYFSQLFRDIPYLSIGLSIFVLIGLFGLIKFIGLSKNNFPLNLWEKLANNIQKNPYLFIPLLIIVGQSILTPNQQERHIYHLYPSLVLGVLIPWKSLVGRRLEKFAIVTLIVGSCFMFYKNLTNKPDVCYAGKKRDVREVPLFIQEMAETNIHSSVILFNDIDDNHINKPDSEWEMDRIAYLRNVSLVKNLKTAFDFGEEKYKLVRISFSCDEKRLAQIEKRIPIEDFRERSEDSSVNLNSNKTMDLKLKWTIYPNPQGRGCWEEANLGVN